MHAGRKVDQTRAKLLGLTFLRSCPRAFYRPYTHGELVFRPCLFGVRLLPLSFSTFYNATSPTGLDPLFFTVQNFHAKFASPMKSVSANRRQRCRDATATIRSDPIRSDRISFLPRTKKTLVSYRFHAPANTFDRLARFTTSSLLRV